jgi:Calcineurin-like phosphoesterase
MSTKNWTLAELEQLKKLTAAGQTVKSMAAILGRSADAIYTKASKVGIQIKYSVAMMPSASSVKQDIEAQDEKYWKREFGSLNSKYQKLLKAENAVDRLVSNISELAPRSYSPSPAAKTGARKRSGHPQAALLMLSDTHIGKQVSPDQTLTFGSYDFDTFMARLKYLEDSIISIVQNHVNTAVPELVVAMLGDMLDGTLTHSNEVGQVDPVFNQYYCGAHALAQFLRNLAPHFPKIRIYDVVGNHTRYQNQHRMPTKNRYSNFDKFLYALVRELVRDIPKIEWTLDAQPYQIFEVQGFTFFGAHGDTMRGGDKTLGVPNHAFGRLVSTATQLMNKYNRKAPNYYLVGHLHRDIVLPHATGSILVNGGFPGVDEFGLGEMFTPADPSQKFFFIHPQYGKTATYDISLKFAEPGKIPPYVIPAEFQMH